MLGKQFLKIVEGTKAHKGNSITCSKESLTLVRSIEIAVRKLKVKVLLTIKLFHKNL